MGQPELSLSAPVQEQIALLVNQPTREHWKESRRKKKKSEYRVKSETAVKTKERNHQNRNKQRRSLGFDSERENRQREQRKYGKELYYPLFAEALKNKDISKIEKYKQKIETSDTTDTNAHGQLVHYYRKQKSYDKLTSYQKGRYNTNPDMWNTASYAQALRLQAKMQSKSQLYNTAQNLYKSLSANVEPQTWEHNCVYGGWLSCLYNKGQYVELKETALQALASYPLSNLSFVLVYVKACVGEGKYDVAEAAYNMLLNGTESPSISADPIYRHLQLCHKVTVAPLKEAIESHEPNIKKEKLLDIYYDMVRLGEKQNDSTAVKKTLWKINLIDPENGFAKKRRG